jgi:hypothetical protein
VVVSLRHTPAYCAAVCNVQYRFHLPDKMCDWYTRCGVLFGALDFIEPIGAVLTGQPGSAVQYTIVQCSVVAVQCSSSAV